MACALIYAVTPAEFDTCLSRLATANWRSPYDEGVLRRHEGSGLLGICRHNLKESYRYRIEQGCLAFRLWRDVDCRIRMPTRAKGIHAGASLAGKKVSDQALNNFVDACDGFKSPKRPGICPASLA
jgi:hypothetical protein